MTEKTPALPSEGGSYIRDEKGGLKPAAPEPVKAPRKSDLKEG